jgi:hypothetical protein
MCVSDWGRIHREFHRHPKVERAGLAGIGLWTLCNSWSRDNRTKGFVPEDVVRGFCNRFGEPDLPFDLVESGLWELIEGQGYRFKDWEEWNADETPKTTSARLVAEVLPSGHPSEVQNKLANEVAKLLEEGIEYSVVKAALKLWLGKSNAAPSWLPMLVSDVTRKGGTAERDVALREAWKTGDTKPLARFGLVFTPPDLPRAINTVEGARFFMLRAKRAWIEQLRKEL